MELELLRAHAVVVHVVGTDNVVFDCLECGERFDTWMLRDPDTGEICDTGLSHLAVVVGFHEQYCDGAIVSMGTERRVRLEEWVMHLRILATAKGMMETIDPEEQAPAEGEHDGQVGVDSHQPPAASHPTEM